MQNKKGFWVLHYLLTAFLFHAGAMYLTFHGLASETVVELNPAMAFFIPTFGLFGLILVALFAYAYFLFAAKRCPLIAKIVLFAFTFDFSWDIITLWTGASIL